MALINRRVYLKKIVLAVSAGAFGIVPRSDPAFSFDTEPQKLELIEFEALTEIASQFMARFEVPGLSVAITKHGRLVYRKGFGYADMIQRERMNEFHLFRIASISKPVTSVCVFCFIEKGVLRLSDFVFGRHGLLGFDYGKNYPDSLNSITVRHLLNHTCGGWGKGNGDPMFMNPWMSHDQLIEWAISGQPLKCTPGTCYEYSNFGYCLLGRILEKISGRIYREVVQESILDKCGIDSMRIAGNTLAERAGSEVVYYGKNGHSPYDMNVSRMDSHGGWIATPSDLLRFSAHVDGFSSTPDILQANTIKNMTAPGIVNPNYACGWSVNQSQNWWHIGSLPGLTSILVRAANGLSWAAFANTYENGIESEIDRMMWRMVKAIPAWRA